jgi:hypothetical protein
MRTISYFFSSSLKATYYLQAQEVSGAQCSHAATTEYLAGTGMHCGGVSEYWVL